MTLKLLLPIIALAVGAPTLIVASSAVDAVEYRRSTVEKKYVAKARKYKDNSYAARAHDLDPAGDYKGYPDWARVALSPKFDGGGSRR